MPRVKKLKFIKTNTDRHDVRMNGLMMDSGL
jgi:hypothetical protein